ncbi:hypothetical protein HPB50_022411 [Hyalomma asiaticum]|uniref:Uncharacterized protein n=1 Tax=Hyalomma asiaticum TaxID=266040 RepID=A0ACB7RWH4_HYAAI|nr:hypothetical protein HPB50_022411 [Hyalomma asiaticum]
MAAPPAAITTTPTYVSTRKSHQQCGVTVLFHPAVPAGTFPGISRLSLAQALSASHAGGPGKHKKKVVAADAITSDWRDRLLSTTEVAGVRVNARMPSDRIESSGIPQGIFGDCTEETLLAGVQSDVPLSASGRPSFCALQHPLRLPRSSSFGWSMLSKVVGHAPAVH